MTDPLLTNIAVPLASETDARATGRALSGRLPEGASVTAIHVIEKAGGAPDKASPAAREEQAEQVFETFRDVFADTVDIKTRTVYSTAVVDGIRDVASEIDATAIVFVPRGGSRLVQFLAGDVALGLIQATDRPVVSLPALNEEDNTDVASGQTETNE